MTTTGERRPRRLPRRPVPAREPAHPEADEAARSAERTLRSRARHGAPRGPTSRCAARSSPASRRDRTRSSTSCSRFCDEAQLDRVGCFAYSPVEGAAANALPDAVPDDGAGRAPRAVHGRAQAAISAARLRDKVGRTLDVLVDSRSTATLRCHGRRRARKSTGP